MRIIDTHLHLIYPDRFSYPWMEQEPAIDRPWPAETYFAEAAALGIEAALHMEVDVAEAEIEAETRFVLSELHPRISGAIAAARPEHADFPAHLERLQAITGVKGIRRILHTQPDALSQSPLFAENIRRLAPLGWTFDLCVLAQQLPIARALVEQCPDVQFVLDHCGNPPIASGDLAAWEAEIRRMAALPNVVAKISGVLANAAPDWQLKEIRSPIEHVIACFGWDRVVWGSDYPVVTKTADLARWVGATREIVETASREEQAKLFSRNAERVYRLERKPQRFGSVIGLRPEAIDEYKRVHAAVWPKVLEQIKRSNISNYSIYLREPENIMFAYLEYRGDDYEADMAAMAADPVTQEWWKVCGPMQQPLPTKAKGEWWAGMEEVFHLD